MHLGKDAFKKNPKTSFECATGDYGGHFFLYIDFLQKTKKNWRFL